MRFNGGLILAAYHSTYLLCKILLQDTLDSNLGISFPRRLEIFWVAIRATI